jgi:hypothetical protein
VITVLHGGQTGVDRGAHEAAIDNGWGIIGYMPRDGRDERGLIPPDIARFLQLHNSTSYAARTEANVRLADALLIVVRDKADPRATPGTAKTIDLAADRRLPRQIVDPTDDAAQIARWIWAMQPKQLLIGLPAKPTHLMVAGPRESKWADARAETAGLLRRVGRELHELGA